MRNAAIMAIATVIIWTKAAYAISMTTMGATTAVTLAATNVARKNSKNRESMESMCNSDPNMVNCVETVSNSPNEGIGILVAILMFGLFASLVYAVYSTVSKALSD